MAPGSAPAPSPRQHREPRPLRDRRTRSQSSSKRRVVAAKHGCQGACQPALHAAAFKQSGEQRRGYDAVARILRIRVRVKARAGETRRVGRVVLRLPGTSCFPQVMKARKERHPLARFVLSQPEPGAELPFRLGGQACFPEGEGHGGNVHEMTGERVVSKRAAAVRSKLRGEVLRSNLQHVRVRGREHDRMPPAPLSMRLTRHHMTND